PPSPHSSSRDRRSQSSSNQIPVPSSRVTTSNAEPRVRDSCWARTVRPALSRRSYSSCPPEHRYRLLLAPGPAATQSGAREARVSPVPLGCGGGPEPVQRPGQPGVQAWAQQRSGQFVAEGTDLIRGDVPRGVREHEMRVVARMAQDPLLHLLASCRRRLLEILLEHI